MEKEQVLAPVGPAYLAQIGPHLTKTSAEKAAGKLREQGFDVDITEGSGMASMTRLLEEIYEEEEARAQLKTVKQ